MAVTRCSKGHYYDDQKFSRCPHCGIFANMDLTKSMGNHAGGNSQEKGTEDGNKTVAMKHSVIEEIQKTVALRDIESQIPEDDQKTIGIYSASKGNDYVTGWLVCVKGPELGRDYRLRHGFNRIGRSLQMNVCIVDDLSITRENHCSIAYDEKSNAFSAVPASGSLTYLNGELLESPKRIETGDRIEIGESELEFVAFCREGRVWGKLQEDI